MTDPDDDAAVLAANAAFYSAFNRRDFPALDQLWAQECPVACAHPGWPPLFGRGRVMESWRRILAGSGAPHLQSADAHAHVVGDAAFVVCYEVVEGARLVATNVFVREQGKWRMAHHHAGPVAAEALGDEPAVDPRSLN